MSQRCSVNAYSDEIYHSIIDSILPTRDWKRSQFSAITRPIRVQMCALFRNTLHNVSRLLVTATRSVEAWKSYNMKVNAIIDYIRGCVFKKTKSCIDDYAHDDCIDESSQ